MTLIRGVNGLCPCPVCLVPSNEQHNPSKKWELRSMEATKNLVTSAEHGKKKDWEPKLKEQGIRGLPVRN
jgi:hypothetical protein